jgi:hypothetical protein
MWPSLVGHCVRDAGVARSNRAIPTISLPNKRTPGSCWSPGFFYCLLPVACSLLFYPTIEPIWNIGRYIATIIPPTTPPRKTMSMGSSMDVIAATATSTSSS